MQLVPVLKTASFDTPLGPMIAVGDDEKLYLLEFVERHRLERQIARLQKRSRATIVPGSVSSIDSIEKEIKDYFNGTLQAFTTPIVCLGSSFQIRVWDELKTIPQAKTCSYQDIAIAIGRPSAYRAVAGANSANQLAIIIPCHRVINTNGSIGGYAGGIARKEWLLNHEKSNHHRKKSLHLV